MDTVLKKPDLGRYNISDHLEFHQLSYRIWDGSAVKVESATAVTDYRDAIAQEETVYKWVRRSEFTVKKAETDYARNRTYKSLATIVHTSMKHFDPAVRDHAIHVYNLLETYGKVTKADYDAETAAIDSLVTRLRGADYQAAVAALGLAGWIDRLDSENTLFKSYVDDTTRERLAKPGIPPRTARHQTDAALRKITGLATALVVLNGPSGLEKVIAEFNMLVSHYNTLMHEHYGRLHARIDIAPAVISEIPAQPCTGKPVFVIPELTLTAERDGKPAMLHPVFSEDFSVAYRNNVNPGTATLIIKGIGKYTGEITTTFNIINSD